MLTRRWPAAVMAAVLLAAMWSLLLGSSVVAQETQDAVETAVAQTPSADPLGQPEAQVPPAQPTTGPESEAPAPTGNATELPVAPEPSTQVPVTAQASEEAVQEPVLEQPAPEVPVAQTPFQPFIVSEEQQLPANPEPEVTVEVQAVPAPETIFSSKPKVLKAANAPPTPETSTAQNEAIDRVNATQGVGVKAEKKEEPEGSPLYVQLIMIAVLLVLGASYFKLMSHSGRRVPAVKSVDQAKDTSTNEKQPSDA